MGTPEFLEILRALQSNDTGVIKAAETRFDQAKTAQPAQTVSVLFEVIGQQQVEQPVREQGSVLLRQCLSKIKDDTSIWIKLGAEGQTMCRAKLLQLMEAEADQKVRRKVADIIQSIGNQLIDIEETDRPNNAQAWPELMPCLMRLIMDSSKDLSMRADALWAVKELQVSIWKIMVANVTQTGQVIKVCLECSDEGVRGHAAELLCEMIDNIESKQDRQPFVPLIEPLCQAVQALAQSADSKRIDSVLQMLSAASECSDFLKEAMASHFLPLISAIAKGHKNEDTQKQALEVLLSFGEARPKPMAKMPGYIATTLEVAVVFLMKMDDDIQLWSENDPEDEDDEEPLSHFGKEVVDRLARCMSKAEKFPEFMQVLEPAIGSLFASGEWKQTTAGVTVLAQIAEFIDEEEKVLAMVTGIKAQLQAQNPRVRCAAWSAVAQFSEDHSDVMTSETLAPELCNLFLKGLEDPNPRTLERAMEAFQHFGEEIERELLEPFVKDMMVKLGQHLQSSRPAVQKKAITFIAVIAGQVEDSFAPYYPHLMPILKPLIQQLLHKTEERVLLGKIFECISLLAKAVGPAAFKVDAEVIMEAMIKATQVPNLPSNDPVKEYMMAAAERICSTMKGEFVPFVPHILPGVLEKLTLAPKEYDPNAANFNEDDEVNLTLVQEGDKVKVLVMHTSDLEDLMNALSCVHTFVEELGPAYAPFVAQTAQALLPAFEFNMSEEIRDLAFETWGQLCTAARTSGQNEILSQLVQEFLSRIMPKLEKWDNLDLQELKTRADGIKTCLEKAGPNILNQTQLKYIGQVSFNTLEESLKRRQADQQTNPKRLRGGITVEDEDEVAGDDDDAEMEMSLRIASCEMLGSMMQHHPDMFVAELMPQVLQVLQGLLNQSTDKDDNRLAIFVACDILEHLKHRATSHWPQFLPQLLQGILSPVPELRQPACYGCSLAAKEAAFAQAAPATAENLAKVIKETRSLPKKKSSRIHQACADNAESALVEILINHQQAVAAVEAQLWSVWLNGLPCQTDEAEGIKNHRYLLELTKAEKPHVVGEGGANMAKILCVLVDVYKSDTADEDTSKGIGQLVVQLGQARLEQLAGAMSDKLKMKLTRIHREASSTPVSTGAPALGGGYPAA